MPVPRTRQLVLLPPSEGKASGGRGKPWAPGRMREAAADGARAELLTALAAAMDAPEATRAQLLKVTGEGLAAATAANRVAASAPTRTAIARYTGVLYDHLDAASLPPTPARRLTSDVLIMSGLWGPVSPRDPVPDYKLAMDATVSGIGKVSTWWRPHLSPLVDARADGAIVWDLLPNAHRAAWRGDPAAPRRRYAVRFTDEVVRDGVTARTTISHWNKALKGALVRYLLAERPTDAEALGAFTHPEGYQLDLDASDLHSGGGTIELVRRV